MRSVATAAGSLGMALGAFGIAVAAPIGGGPETPVAALDDSSGALLISNSRAGEAVFDAGPMAPGQTVAGTVRIGNAGERAGRFSVGVTGVQDTLGPYGGALSERVQLSLVDVARGATVFQGLPAELPAADLGTFAAGAEREYSVTATFPDGGVPAGATTGDNAYQGAALSLDLGWTAVARGDAPVVPPVRPPAPRPPAPRPPGQGEVLGEQLVPPQSSGGACARKRRKPVKIRLRVPRGVRVLAATVRVNRKIKKRVKGSKRRVVKLRRLPAGRMRIVVRVRASNHRVYISKRLYRACKAKPVRKRKSVRAWR